jgi:hypothetical protein
MSKTVIEIVQDGTYRAAQPPQVGVAEGNQIEFVNAGSIGTLLVLTAETESILSPKPNSSVTLAGGATVTYTFLAPTGSSYLAQVLPEGAAPGPVDGAGADGPVLTILPSGNRGDLRTGG